MKNITRCLFMATLAAPFYILRLSGASVWIADPAAISASPGDAISFTLMLSTDSESYGVSYFLSASGAGSGHFSLIGRDITGSTFTDLITTNAVLLAEPGAVLDPINAHDAGAGVADPFTPNSAGDWRVAVLTVQSAPGIPTGIYAIDIVNGFLDDGIAGEVIPTQSITIEIVPVPEPAAGMLLGLSLAAWAIRRR